MHFFAPGTTTAAFTTAFGIVFADVDGALNAAIAPSFDGGLSFLGVQLTGGQQIGRVHIRSGDVALGPNDAPGVDVIAMDDFIYAEPNVVTPEPATWALMAGGLGLLGTFARRRATLHT